MCASIVSCSSNRVDDEEAYIDDEMGEDIYDDYDSKESEEDTYEVDKDSNDVNGDAYENTSDESDELEYNYHIHDFLDATCTEPATCDCGYTFGEPLGHDFAGKTCKRCDEPNPDYKDPKNIKDIALNEFVTVNTEHGSFEIAVCGAAVERDTDYKNTQGEYDYVKDVGVLCKITNINFSGLHDNELCAYDLSEKMYGYVEILDESGFRAGHVDRSGSPLLSYSVGGHVPIGSNAKIAMIVNVEKTNNKLTVVINQEYRVQVEITGRRSD